MSFFGFWEPILHLQYMLLTAPNTTSDNRSVNLYDVLGIVCENGLWFITKFPAGIEYFRTDFSVAWIPADEVNGKGFKANLIEIIWFALESCIGKCNFEFSALNNEISMHRLVLNIYTLLENVFFWINVLFLRFSHPILNFFKTEPIRRKSRGSNYA